MNHFFTRHLLQWHETLERPLPWKGEKNPYFIWLSEIILQQTRAEQGTPYYLKFRSRFPDIVSLARADEDEVLRLWQGLGYYTRARNLHAAAKHIRDNLAGKFPDDYAVIRSLKGVGDYTAAAIASFAFNQPYPVVDGNVYRVLSRFFGIRTPIDSSDGKKEFRKLAEKLMPKEKAALFNQAIMDFGAVQCVPVKPGCDSCPMRKNCVACSEGIVAELPVKAKKKKSKQRFFHYLVIKEGDYFYLRKRAGKDIWKNMYEFPMFEHTRLLDEKKLRQRIIRQPFLRGCKIAGVRFAGKYRQTLTHQKITAVFYEAEGILNNSENGLLKTRKRDLGKRAFPGIVRLYLAQHVFHDKTTPRGKRQPKSSPGKKRADG